MVPSCMIRNQESILCFLYNHRLEFIDVQGSRSYLLNKAYTFIRKELIKYPFIYQIFYVLHIRIF